MIAFLEAINRLAATIAHLYRTCVLYLQNRNFSLISCAFSVRLHVLCHRSRFLRLTNLNENYHSKLIQFTSSACYSLFALLMSRSETVLFSQYAHQRTTQTKSNKNKLRSKCG